MTASEFEGFLVKELIDPFLNPMTLGEIAVGLHIVYFIQNFFAAKSENSGAPMSAETTEAVEVNFETEALGRWRGDPVENGNEVLVGVEQLDDLVLLLGGDAMEEGVGALLPFQ